MHKLIPVLIIALFGFGSADGQYKNATDDTSVVAEVDGEHIYLERFRNEYIDHLFKTGIADSPRVRNAFLERTIQKMLVVQQARKSRVVEQPGFELERARVERKLLIEGLLFAEVYSRVEVSESDLREMFESTPRSRRGTSMLRQKLRQTRYINDYSPVRISKRLPQSYLRIRYCRLTVGYWNHLASTKWIRRLKMPHIS